MKSVGRRQRAAKGLCGTLILVVVSGLAGCGGEPEVTNVLLISIDTLRADHLGCYGNQAAATPRIDALAKQGLRFSRCSSPVPITLPSHTSMFSGLYPLRHSVRDNGMFKVPEDLPTLATVLGEAGWTTAGVIGSFPLTAQFGLARGFEIWDEDFTVDRTGVLQLFFDERPADAVTHRVIEVLEEVADRPFFLFVHYFDPHHPWMPPAAYTQRFPNSGYDAEIAFVDVWVGALLDRLDELGLTESTLVILAADHGEGLNDHEEFTHSILLYEGTQNVPLILRGPGIDGGLEERPVSLVDVAPTVLEILGIDAPMEMDGVSLLGPDPVDRMLYVESLSGRLLHGWNDMRAAVNGRHKLILGVPSELYDVVDDPGERHDLASTEPELAAAMETELRDFIDGAQMQWSIAERFSAPDGEVRAALEALGYLVTEDPGSIGDELGPINPEDDPRHHVYSLQVVSHARQAMFDRDFTNAIAMLEDALFAAPDDGEVLMNLSNARLLAADWDGAATTARRLLEIRPRSSSAYLLLALAEGGRGEPGRAAAVLKEGLEACGPSTDLQLELAIAHMRLEDPGVARDVLGEVLAASPCHRDALVMLGNIGNLLGDRESMRSVYSTMLECSPTETLALYNLGNLAVEDGDPDRARSLYLRAVAADPDYFPAYHGLAVVDFAGGRLDDARREAGEALRLAGNGSPIARKTIELLEAIDRAQKNSD